MKVHVRSGLDNLKLAHDALNGRRIGLLTHPCGFDSTFTSTIDILHANYRLTALFACEHGIRGSVVAGAHIDQETDAATGLPVFSLYGDTKMPTPEMLSEIDVFVVDLQDVGARFYTYICSLAFAMIACARAGKPIVVLDRINPIGGRTVQGTLLDERFHSFVGEYAVPTRYGLTIGEFARFVKDHLKLDVDLTVVPLTGWKRGMLWEDTDAVWAPPSPNIPTPHTALVYIGTCIFEGTNLSEGRGTTTPFYVVGAPFIDAVRLTARMRALNLPGVGFMPAYFTPTTSKWNGEACQGARLFLASGEADAFAAGLYLLEAILDLYPRDAKFLSDDPSALAGTNLLLGTDEFRAGGLSAAEVIKKHRPLVEDFKRRSEKYYLYE